MKHFVSIVMLFCAGALAADPASAGSSAGNRPALDCHVGPVTKTFGGTSWLVYSCSDHKTLVIVSARGNPAAPFYFLFYPTANGYKIGGEGNGPKDVTDATYKELESFSPHDIQELIDETEKAGTSH